MHQYDIDAQYQDQSKELNLKNKNVKKAELIAPTFPHFGPIWKKWLLSRSQLSGGGGVGFQLWEKMPTVFP